MSDLDKVLQHAQLAHFDNELTSFVILMITNKKEPELHMVISSDDIYPMNAVTDMLKIEMLKQMTAKTEERKQRE